MKTTLLLIFSLFSTVSIFAQTLTVSGTVSDSHERLAGVNVWIDGTLDGCLTDSAGCFSFQTKTRDTLVVCVSCLGYETMRKQLAQADASNINIKMRPQTVGLKEVVVTGSSFRFGNTGETRSMNAMDVVYQGGSTGDIVAALQSLPGTQKVGEDGKLYVRGGSSEECQTFINGMHVLEPYTVHSANDAVRGRFSPFLFKGMNFSLGGYSAEYGQALSAVLPMETTDRQSADKFGVSASLLDWNAGGTKAFGRSSLSFNATYMNLRAYNHIVPSDIDWSRPFEDFSGEAQFKADLSEQWQWKTYVGYDFTRLGMDDYEERDLRLRQQNYYANSTLHGTLAHDWTLFFGIAGSTVLDRMDDALVRGDHYHRNRHEIHLKATAKKYFGSAWKVMAGVEDYIRKNLLRYSTLEKNTSAQTANERQAAYNLHYQIPALFADAQTRIARSLFLRLSIRLEEATDNHQWLPMPRASLSYVPTRNFQASLIGGRYSQAADDDYMARSGNSLRTPIADHAIISVQYGDGNTSARIEAYYKRYRQLPLFDQNASSDDTTNPWGTCTSDGHGTSKGIDCFVESHWLKNRIFTRLSYSYNDSKRLYLDYTTERMPEYASRHNIRLSIQCFVSNKLSMSLANSYSSGRLSERRKTPYYNSLDASLTWLADKKVIVYASCNNLLGRKNIYGYNAGMPITNSSRRSLYIGIFISLKSNKAYDISNF